ncbi:MAG: response regulator [Polyangiaceae bacterium]|jgi:CheY-like chemotaxis protein
MSTTSTAGADCILVVDDDQAIRETLVEVLEEGGCHAVGAANGAQAMDLLERQPRDRRTCLILLDLMMPVMDGPTFRQEQLRKADLADIPVVVITAFQDAAANQGSMNATEILIKPLQITDIMRVAKQFCECGASSSP